MGADFTLDQKRWLEGFASGAAAIVVSPGRRRPAPPAPAEPTGPDAAQLKAQDRTASAGKKLVDQEKWKRAEHPIDAYERLKTEALGGAKPKPEDNFRWRYHGLFYVAPAQDSYMCRLRIPNGILTHWQFAASPTSPNVGGGYTHVTTRANLQIREIHAAERARRGRRARGLGIVAKGAGRRQHPQRHRLGHRRHRPAGTPRHPPACPGVAPPHPQQPRRCTGLPRKFNVAFDGGGAVPTLEDTNDIGFQAVEVAEGAPVEPGVWYRLTLGGITGHKDFARDTGVIVDARGRVEVADAIVRVFIDHGDRTDRTKARLKYVLDDWGFEKFLADVEEKLGGS